MEEAEERKCSRINSSEYPQSNNEVKNAISVKMADIPPYLQKSQFYLSLQKDGEFPVPKECMKMDDSVNSRDDLRILLLTLRFWVTDGISDSVLDFAMSQPFESYEDILSEFYEDLPAVKHIKTIALSPTPMLSAIECCVLDFVKYFRTRGYPWPDHTCDIICQTGNVMVLEYAIQEDCLITADAAAVAAGLGYIACLQLLHANNAPWDAKTTSAAAKGGHVNCLKYAHENGCPWLCSEEEPDSGYLFETYDEASDYGSSEEVSFAEGDYEQDDIGTGANPVENGNYHDEVNSGSDTDSDPIFDMDADDGLDVASLHTADYARMPDSSNYNKRLEDGMNNICTIAAVHGNLECLEYAHRHGVVLQPMTIKAAARHPKGLECLKYAHQQGLPLTHFLSLNAAFNGNLEMLQYLHTHGCPWDSRVCCAAAYKIGKSSSTACTVVLFLLRNGCAPSSDIWDFTGDEFHQILQCFLELGLPWSATPEATLRAARVNNLEG